MKKPYSLDYSIERDIDRVTAVYNILDKLEKSPTPNDLELMASYILYGKDENGLNAVQRGEISNGNTRFNSYRTKDDKAISLDGLLDNPLADQTELRPAQSRDPYTHKLRQIRRPKYSRDGTLIDIGDSDIPGMQELWQCIDRMDKWLAQLDGRLPPDENTKLDDNSYHVYQLRHSLIDMRRHQYYLKDAYKPALHFIAADHPKPQFINWCADSFYWISLEEWQHRVDNALLASISHNLNDYEQRLNPYTHSIEVKWIVKKHIFNWEDPSHVRAFINNYELLYNQLEEKLNTDGRMLFFDFDRYRKMTHFTPVREFLIDHKLRQTPYDEVLSELYSLYGLTYNENHLCTIYAQEIPAKIAETALRHRLLVETPQSKCKKCSRCGRILPQIPLFFTKNKTHKDGLSSACKDCEKNRRVEKGGQTTYDRRRKESEMYEMQANQT